MIVQSVKHDVQTSGIMQVAKATIKASAKLFSFFADQTYSNKPLAIARELVANGIDSHTAAGFPQRAVEVTLPIELDPVFKVRDFGVGMSHEFMMTRYMAYTDSTKDGSNDAIGGFGIGRWSCFSYTSQFTVRSVHEGMLGIYSAFKDEDGVPAIGCMALAPTSEPNGVEVSFPVEVDDIATFHEAAQQALQYFRPLPVVINGALTAPDFTYMGDDWAIRPQAGPLGVILGGVRYPVSTNNLESTLRYNSRLSPLLEYGLDLWMPIGACGVALSREALSYDNTTSVAIAAKLEAVIDDVIKTFSNMFDSCPTRWDAQKMLAKEVGFESYRSNGRQNLLRANARYQGAPLTTEVNLRAAGVLANCWVIEGRGGRRAATSLKSPKWDSTDTVGSLRPGAIGVVIVDDLPISPKSKVGPKVREYMGNVDRSFMSVVLRPHFNVDPTEFSDLLGGAPVVYTSSMPEPARIQRVKNERPRVRMFTFDGNDNINNLTPGWAKDRYVSEIDYADQPADGIAVVMNSFDLPGDFRKKMMSGLVTYDELHFVNAGDWPKLKDNWQNFDDVFAERLADALAEYPELPTRIALYRDRELSSFFVTASFLGGTVGMSPAQVRRPFGRIALLWETYVKPLTADQHRLAPFVTAALPARVDPGKLVAAFNKEQADAALLREVLSLSSAAHRALFLKNL